MLSPLSLLLTTLAFAPDTAHDVSALAERATELVNTLATINQRRGKRRIVLDVSAILEATA
jgi:hypothetical protein